MKNINVKLDEHEAEIITKNLLNVSRSLGYRVNISALIKHILTTTTSKKSLYDLGFISKFELETIPIVKKGHRVININTRKMRK